MVSLPLKIFAYSELGDGHYWVNDPGLKINVPLRIVGDENDPSHVVIELSGTVVFNEVRGWMEGLTLRRPRIAAGERQSCESLRVTCGAKLDMTSCVLDNDGCLGNVALLKGSSKGCWKDVEIRGSGQQGCGVAIYDNSHLELIHVSFNV